MTNQPYNPFFNPQLMNPQSQAPQNATPPVYTATNANYAPRQPINTVPTVNANPFLNYSALSRLAQENNTTTNETAMKVKPSVQSFDAFQAPDTSAATVMTTLVVGAVTVAMAALLVIFGTNQSQQLEQVRAQVANSYESQIANLTNQNSNLVAQVVNPQLNNNVLGVTTTQKQTFSVSSNTTQLNYNEVSNMTFTLNNPNSNPVELYVRFDPTKVEVVNKKLLVSSNVFVITTTSNTATVSVKPLSKGDLSFTVFANDGVRKSIMLGADGTMSYLASDVTFTAVSK